MNVEFVHRFSMFYIVLWSDGVGVFTHISNFWGPLKAFQTVSVCAHC